MARPTTLLRRERLAHLAKRINADAHPREALLAFAEGLGCRESSLKEIAGQLVEEFGKWREAINGR